MSKIRVLGFAVSLLLILILTAVFKLTIHLNVATVALIYLLTVVGTSAFWGYLPGILAALFSGLLFNYYFLPPFGTLYIAAPENWTAFVVYLVCAWAVSHLTADIHQKKIRLNQLNAQMQTISGITESYLTAEKISESMLHSAVEKLRESFGARYCAAGFFFPDGRRNFAASGQGPEVWKADSPKSIVDLAAEAGLEYRYEIVHLNNQTVAVLLTSSDLSDSHVRRLALLLLALLQISSPADCYQGGMSLI